jgi:F-type H+-transporting ATPase subunit a
MTFDPIHQFEIHDLLPLFTIAGREIRFTNSAFYMLVSVALIFLLMLAATRQRRLVPARLQSFAEMIYEFVANMIRSTAGEEGMKFFPLVFSLFMFILISNVIGIIPYTFTVSSQIIITASLALMVFFTVIVYGFYKNGVGFLKLFVPQGTPMFILPLVVVIEVISFFTRPISHSVRLFANMLAGHMTLNVFAAFAVMLGGIGVAGWLAAFLPLALTVALTALELVVAVLQAYVFAILTCVYLRDALHPGH